MPMDSREFLIEYSGALRVGVASLFVGAGTSMGSGLPSWDGLLEPLRAKADVPSTVVDPTVVAEYLSNYYGPRQFEDKLLERFRIPMRPSAAHALISGLPLKNIWTTNYDTLLEQAHPSKFVLMNDSGYSQAKLAPRLTRIVKLHGSLGIDENDLLIWRVPPVITRSHFETYATDHPLFWADLTASFLTSTFLFLGFSFDDPNVEVLLRLSRTIRPEIRRSPHYAIMRRPPAIEGADAVRGHELRVGDLERAGIFVIEIDEFAEIDELLAELTRLSHPPRLFVAGSALSVDGNHIVQAVGERLARTHPDWSAVSLGGRASYEFAAGMKRGMGEGYDPERIRFYFRKRPEIDYVPRPKDRVGTAIYSEAPREELVPKTLRSSRAVFVAGGGEHTRDETVWARRLGLPIVALPIDGGVALEVWDERPPVEQFARETKDMEYWVSRMSREIATALAITDASG